MKKEDFQELLQEKARASQEALEDWEEDSFADAAFKAHKLGNTSIQVYEEEVPLGISIEEVANYLEGEGHTIQRLFDNEMSGKGKSFIVDWS